MGGFIPLLVTNLGYENIIIKEKGAQLEMFSGTYANKG